MQGRNFSLSQLNCGFQPPASISGKPLPAVFKTPRCPRRQPRIVACAVPTSTIKTFTVATLAVAHLHAAMLSGAPVLASTIVVKQHNLDPSSVVMAAEPTATEGDRGGEVITLRDGSSGQVSNVTDKGVVNKAKVNLDQEMEDMTRRNTRVSGRASQQFSQARRFAEQGDLDGALRAYDKLIDLAPTFAPGYSNRANLLVVKGRLDDAITDYSHAIELAPKDGDTWVLFLNRGSTRLALGQDPRIALDDLNESYTRKGADPLVLANRAAAYEALGKWESALRDYQNALKGNNVQPFWLRYALVLFERGKSTEAIGILKRVLNNFKVDDVKAAMAAIFYENGDLASAETMWNEMERPRQFESRAFLESRKWPPRAVSAMDNFRSLRQ